MKLPYTEIAASLFMLISVSPIEGVGGMINAFTASVMSGGRFTGAWTSYTPTRFGERSVEFFGNGKCQLRPSADGKLPCKWQETGNGRRTTIQATVSGNTEVYYATIAGDTMIVKEPGRETPYVRVNSREAYERQRLAKGPS